MQSKPPPTAAAGPNWRRRSDKPLGILRLPVEKWLQRPVNRYAFGVAAELHRCVGARLCTIYSAIFDGISLEILPVSPFFDTENRQVSVIIELMSLAVWLSCRRGRV